MRRLGAFLLALLALPASAAERVRLVALGPSAERAILAFGPEWVEVELGSGATRALTPPPTCGWTSGAFDPAGGGLALSAECLPEHGCAGRRAGLYRTDAAGRLVHLATADGRRWRGALWRAEGGAVLLTETPLETKGARRLGDLGAGGDCAEGPARLVEIRVPDGRRALLDILPRGMVAARALGAAGMRIVAVLRPRASRPAAASAPGEGPAGGPGPEGGDGRGRAEPREWDGAEWRAIEDGAPPAARRLLSADLSVAARERCRAGRGRGPARCDFEIEGPAARLRLAPPRPGGRRFRDVALAGDGRRFAALLARPGAPASRFLLYDVASGAARDLTPLLALGRPWGPPR